MKTSGRINMIVLLSSLFMPFYFMKNSVSNPVVAAENLIYILLNHTVAKVK